MTYISGSAPRDYGFHALITYPYVEGVRNLREASTQPELWGRIKQVFVGIVLLIPLINTIAFLILRDEIYGRTVDQQRRRGEVFPMERLSPETEQERFDTVNDERAHLTTTLRNLRTALTLWQETPNAVPEAIEIQQHPFSVVDEAINELHQTKHNLIQQWNTWRLRDHSVFQNITLPTVPPFWSYEPLHATLNRINNQRNEALAQGTPHFQHIASLTYSLITELTLCEIIFLEQYALDHNLIELNHVESVQTHLDVSRRCPPELVALDSRTFERRPRTIRCAPLPNASFVQHSGVSQCTGSNQLCGYYSLFYLYEAVTQTRRFNDRSSWHPILARWTRMVAKRRAQNWLASHRTEEMPLALSVSVKGISATEIQYLIENDPLLQPLRHTNNCLVLDLQAWRNAADESEILLSQGAISSIEEFESVSTAMTPLGNRTHAPGFPMYIILLEGITGIGHYYCVFAETPWNFEIINPLNSSSINDLYFRYRTLRGLLRCLDSHHLLPHN